MVGGHTGDKVVQQVLTRHQQTRETDESHMQPLEPAKTSRLTMATRLKEKQSHICIIGFKEELSKR